MAQINTDKKKEDNSISDELKPACDWFFFLGASSKFHCCCDFLMSLAFIILSHASRRPEEMRALLRQVGQHTAVTTPAELSAL